jgi:type II secretory pathway pseudopilin PulG
MKIMNTKSVTPRWGRKGVTLIELTVVISVILSMIGTTMYFGGNMSAWKKGKEASEGLRSVYAAQRGFLADNPRRTLISIDPDELVSYLPNRTGVMPEIKSLNEVTLEIDVNVSPPVCRTPGGVLYDPSSSNDDSLWDVGS